MNKYVKMSEKELDVDDYLLLGWEEDHINNDKEFGIRSAGCDCCSEETRNIPKKEYLALLKKMKKIINEEINDLETPKEKTTGEQK